APSQQAPTRRSRRQGTDANSPAATLHSPATSALGYVNGPCAEKATARIHSARCATEIHSAASDRGAPVGHPLPLRRSDAHKLGRTMQPADQESDNYR